MCDTLLYPHTCGRYFLFEKSLSKNTNVPHCPTLYPNSLPPLKPPPFFFLCQTRKHAQETAVPHVRLLACGQVHPGNGAMCDRRHVADTVQGAVTVIRITMNFIQIGEKKETPH